MGRLTTLSKVLIPVILATTVGLAVFVGRDRVSFRVVTQLPPPPASPNQTPLPSAAPAPAPRPRGKVIVALSQWPGHLALVIGNGGLTTQRGSAAAAAGLD